MGIEFGEIRSKLHDSTAPPEHIMCELAHLLDPSTYGYERADRDRFNDEIRTYVESAFLRRDLSGPRSLFMSNAHDLDGLWSILLEDADHLRFYNSHASYGKRHRVSYTQTQVSGPRGSMSFLVSKIREAKLKLSAIEVDFGEVDNAFLTAAFDDLDPFLADGPIHAALGDHISSCRSNFGSNYRMVSRFITACSRGDRQLSGVRCDGTGIFGRGRSLGDFGFMRALSSARGDEYLDIKELSLIRAFSPAASAYQKQFSRDLAGTLAHFPDLERLEVGVVHVMLDDLWSDRTAHEISRLNTVREGSKIKRLALVINCSMTSRHNDFEKLFLDLARAVNTLHTQGFRFIEIGIVSRIDASIVYKDGMPENFNEARKKVLDRAAKEAASCLKDVRVGDWGFRVWTQSMNIGAVDRHLVDEMVVVEDEGWEDEQVFTRFDVHPFHYL